MARYLPLHVTRRRPRWLAGALGAVAATAVVLAPAWAGVAAAQAPSGITVIGQGIVRADPDTAIITVGAAATAPTVEQATARVGGEIDSFVTALKWQGIADRDVRTIALNIYPQYAPRPPFPSGTAAAAPPPPPSATPPPVPFALPPRAALAAEQALPPIVPPPPLIVGYRVEQVLEVRTHEIGSAGAIIETAVRVLGRDILLQGTRFTIENTDPLRDQARAQAFANARAAAEQLARLAGVRLGAPQHHGDRLRPADTDPGRGNGRAWRHRSGARRPERGERGGTRHVRHPAVAEAGAFRRGAKLLR